QGGGVRDRGFHPAGRIANRFRRAPPRRPPRQGSPLHRQGRDRVRPQDPQLPPREDAGPGEAGPGREESAAGKGRRLDRAEAGRTGLLPRVDRRRAPAPARVPGPAGRQEGLGCRLPGRREMKARSRSGIADPKSEVPLTLSNPNKVFWPDEGYTKLDLARFYDAVFPKLRPYVEDRLLSLKRCPDGLLGKCFFQKEKPDSMPADTPTKRIVHENGVRNYVLGGKLETQLALVNLGCIAVH